jgi:dethiobiotin synthetase
MEGNGGILCPIHINEHELWLEDIVKTFEMSSIIVANAGLGTINHTILTVEYMRHNNLPIKGIILNHFHPGDEMEEDNLKMIEHRTKLPVLCCVKDGDSELEINPEHLASLYD